MAASQVLHFGVNLLETTDSLATILAAFLLAGNGTPCSSQFGKCSLEVSRIRLRRPFAGCQEVHEPNVDTSSRLAALDERNVRQFTGDNDKPLARFPFQGERLYFPFDESMQLDTNRADVLNTKAISDQTDTISVGREFNTIEEVTALESWVARLATSFLDTSEEVGKRLIQSAHGSLGTGEVEASKPRIDGPLGLEPGRLFGIANRPLIGLVSRLSLVKTGVVQATMRFEHNQKLPLLINIGKQSVLEGSPHE